MKKKIKVNSRIKEIENGYWEKFNKEIELDLRDFQKRIWKMLEGMRNEVNATNINREERTKYFNTLHNEEKADDAQKLLEPYQKN